MLGNGLVWDDHIFLEQWPAIKNFSSIGAMFTGIAPPGQDKLYRPLRGVLYIFDYHLWGTQAFGYHLQALVLHLGMTVLIYLIVDLLLKNKWYAFCVSLLFGTHPIHTETIDYIASSMESIGTVFFFVSLYLYLRVKDFSKPSNTYLCSIFLAAGAFFSYELTLTLPLVLFLIDICFSKTTFTFKKFSVLSLLRYSPYFLLASVYLFLRFGFFHIISRNAYLGYSFFLTMQVMVKVFARYIGLLFFPINLTTNHVLVGNFPDSMLPYDKLDPILHQSLKDPSFIISLSILVGLVVSSIYLFKRYPLFTFAVFWFFITLLPVSNIIPHGSSMSEKFLYIPSFGFLLLLVDLIYKVCQKAYKENIFPKELATYWVLFVVILSGVYGYLTFTRNTVWKNDISLFSDMVVKDPESLIGNYTLGVRYGENNDPKHSIVAYEKVIKKSPEFWQAHFNLGNAYVQINDLAAAKEEYIKTLELQPTMKQAKINLNKLMSAPEASISAVSGGDISVKHYDTNGVSFEYPNEWNESIQDTITVLTDASDRYSIKFIKHENSALSSAEFSLRSGEVLDGIIIQQGQAMIPTVDSAYVRIWQKDSINTMQFFLFNGSFVVELIVSPAAKESLVVFDQIAKSIRF